MKSPSVYYTVSGETAPFNSQALVQLVLDPRPP